MPLYEYECETCGHRFEKIQKFSDALETVCPKCSGVLRKLMSSPAIQFKGSGFYITDYGKKDSGSDARSETRARADAKADAQSDARSGGSAPADTKPEKTEKAEKAEKTEPKAATPAAAPTKTD